MKIKLRKMSALLLGIVFLVSPVAEAKASSKYVDTKTTIEDKANYNKVEFNEGTLYSIDDIFPNLDQKTKDKILEETLEYVELKNKNKISAFSVDDGNKLKTEMGELSPQEVRDLKDRADTTKEAANLIIGIINAEAGVALTIANMIFGSPIDTAAKNGWGLKIYFVADKYNPTSSGMRWEYEYVK